MPLLEAIAHFGHIPTHACILLGGNAVEHSVKPAQRVDNHGHTLALQKFGHPGSRPRYHGRIAPEIQPHLVRIVIGHIFAHLPHAVVEGIAIPRYAEITLVGRHYVSVVHKPHHAQIGHGRVVIAPGDSAIDIDLALGHQRGQLIEEIIKIPGRIAHEKQ